MLPRQLCSLLLSYHPSQQNWRRGAKWVQTPMPRLPANAPTASRPQRSIIIIMTPKSTHALCSRIVVSSCQSARQSHSRIFWGRTPCCNCPPTRAQLHKSTTAQEHSKSSSLRAAENSVHDLRLNSHNQHNRAMAGFVLLCLAHTCFVTTCSPARRHQNLASALPKLCAHQAPTSARTCCRLAAPQARCCVRCCLLCKPTAVEAAQGSMDSNLTAA